MYAIDERQCQDYNGLGIYSKEGGVIADAIFL